MMPDCCPRCGLPLVTDAHICIVRAEMRQAPQLEIVDWSEINGEVDSAGRGVDGVFRPVFIGQDDGQCLTLTIEDAKRLLEFLTEAMDYVEARNWRKN